MHLLCHELSAVWPLHQNGGGVPITFEKFVFSECLKEWTGDTSALEQALPWPQTSPGKTDVLRAEKSIQSVCQDQVRLEQLLPISDKC